ncbi:MAG: 16S rRNA (adenine(1518)-N(6)/adenine(1519)-N(6))-dimethyltransferase RsmA [bacterium]
MPKYSQNFLTNPAVAEKIASACVPDPEDIVVEIGPGRGFLTGFLIKLYPGRMIAVEIDPAMVRSLKAKFEGAHLRVVEEDFLKTDLEQLCGGKRAVLAGNLPYDVASPILQKVLGWKNFHRAIFMFQKEVAERITAVPGSRDYGVLTLAVRSRADVTMLLGVDKSNFQPVPKVDSAVLIFRRRSEVFFSLPEDERNFFAAVKAAFAHRRKTILNSMSSATDISKENLKAALESAGIDPALRAEAVAMESYLALSRRVPAAFHGQPFGIIQK